MDPTTIRAAEKALGAYLRGEAAHSRRLLAAMSRADLADVRHAANRIRIMISGVAADAPGRADHGNNAVRHDYTVMPHFDSSGGCWCHCAQCYSDGACICFDCTTALHGHGAR